MCTVAFALLSGDELREQQHKAPRSQHAAPLGEALLHRLSRKVLARPRRRHVWQAALAVDRLCRIDPVTLMSSRATFGLRAYPQRFGNTREVARCRAVVTVGGSRLAHRPQITVCDCLSRAYIPELPVFTTTIHTTVGSTIAPA